MAAGITSLMHPRQRKSLLGEEICSLAHATTTWPNMKGGGGRLDTDKRKTFLQITTLATNSKTRKKMCISSLVKHFPLLSSSAWIFERLKEKILSTFHFKNTPLVPVHFVY